MPAVRTTIMEASWAAIPGSPIDSSVYNCQPGAKSVTVHFSATVGGTYQLFYRHHTGRQVELTAPVVVVADQLVRTFFNGIVPQMLARFTPTAINGRADVEVSAAVG